MSDFDVALKKALVHEGGYSNHPKDPGGATNKGITQRVYDGYRDRKGQPSQSVKLITDIEVQAIYRANYWDLAKCDMLPAGVNYVVFDGAVNSGVGQSVKWLQRALGVNADGVIGPATISAADAFGNNDELVDRICDRRLTFLKALTTWSTFGKGWAARVFNVRATGKALASDNSVLPMTAYADGGDAKAALSDGKKPPSKAIADTATGAGGLSAIIAQTQEQLTPYVNIGFVAKAAAFLTIAGMIVAVAGIGYRLWASRQKAKIEDALDTKAA